MTRDATLIITSVGSLVGQNILDALEGRRQRLTVVGLNSVVDAPNNFRCDRVHQLPPLDAGEVYQQRFQELLAREEPNLIIPGRDADVVELARQGEEHPELAARLLVGSLAAARVMDDKAASHDFARTHGLPFADTVTSGLPDSLEQGERLRANHGFPLLAKPRQGHGSLGVRLLFRQEQLARLLRQPGWVVQPLLDPRPGVAELDFELGMPCQWSLPETRLFGVQTLIGRDGGLGPSQGYIATMVLGRCERLTRRDDAELLAIADDFARAMAAAGWRGAFNLQLKKDPRLGFQAIEMNGRFSGGTSARLLLGFDEVGWCVNHWLGRAVVPLAPVTPCREVARLFRDVPMDDAAVTALQEFGQWTPSC